MIGSTNAGSAVKTILVVTITDPTSSGYQQGRAVTATNGSDTQIGTTDSAGVVTFYLRSTGDYTITSDAPAGGTASPVTVQVDLGGSYATSIMLKFGWGIFSMSFNPTTFQTDPSGCLEYGDDCLGYTPVSGPGSSLAKCSTIGSWEMKSDGTSTNPLLNECFYATFTNAGVPHQKLNPQNLSQYIATWDNVNKVWVAATGSSAITTENTMFCIPKCYISATADKLILSSMIGAPFAHTIGGHTYDYVAIGVYEGYDDGSRLWSLSGKASTASKTRPTFRTHARANTVQNGSAMVWNFYQWNLWRIMTLFAMKSFDGQTKIGQGGFKYDGTTGQGLCNSMGPFAGATTTSASVSTSVKAFIENPWGYKYEFIDDFVVNSVSSSSHEIWAGQNAQPDDTYTSPNKTKIVTSGVSGGGDFGRVIDTSAQAWGFPIEGGASSTTGLCDRIYFNSSAGQYLGFVGGFSSLVSGGFAGPSYLLANGALDYSNTGLGARLAFVFDL